MKVFGFKLPPWYEWVYVAIAIATFKHSSWAYSITMEGKEPLMDWANFSPTLPMIWALLGYLSWYFWGGLMAAAIDVSMFFASREIRRGNKAHLLTFVIAATFSAATQLLYASTHAAAVTYVQTTLAAMAPNTGWLWVIDESRIMYLPLSLPLTATIYTAAILWGNYHRVRTSHGVFAIEDASEAPVIVGSNGHGHSTDLTDPHRVPVIDEQFFSAREAASITGRNYRYVLTMCKRGIVGEKIEKENGVEEWHLSEADLRRLDRGGIHKDEEVEALEEE